MDMKVNQLTQVTQPEAASPVKDSMVGLSLP